jgi:anti-sigma factor RsiW
MSRHDETAIIPWLRGELPDAERRAVESHLAGCADCRAAAEDFRALLATLAAEAPEPPAVNWGAYRAELREKLDRRRGGPRWWPVPLALSGALAAGLVFLVVGHTPRDSRLAELTAVEETVIGGRLDLLRQYPVVERLELLEDLEVIRNLDRLDPVKES